MAHEEARSSVEALLSRLQAKGETIGVGPLAGRLVGHMMVCEPPCQTAAEVAAALDAPEDRVETLLDGLAAWGSLTRVAPGPDSPACFAMASLEEIVQERSALIEELRGMLDEVVTAELSPEARERLTTMRDFYAFLEGELPALMGRWHARQAAPQAR